MMRFKVALLAAGMLLSGMASAEVCTTQSQMTPADRDALATTARSLATEVQADNVKGLQSATVAEYAKDFSGIGDVVSSTAAKLKGGTVAVEQVYLLDGTQLKKNTDGSAPDAQFFCSLNKSVAEVDFLIPGLLPGRYGFVVVNVQSPSPWQLSFLLRQDQGRWAMAGFYPKALTAAGHDGIWYWTQARAMATRNEHWNAWLYYQQAQSLLQPTGFVQSSHLEKLKTEQTAAAPPALSDGISPTAPLVVKGAAGTDYRFVGLGVDDSLGASKIDVVAHLQVDAAAADPAAAKKRNADAASALLAAYPELRKAFHGVWIFAETAGQNPYATEEAMGEIH